MSRTTYFAALAGALLACDLNRERPPPPVCVGQCGPNGGVTVGGVPPGTTGGEGGGAAVDEEAVTLRGDVVLVNDLLSLTGEPYLDRATLRIDAPESSDVSGTWNGADDFEIADVLRGGAVWAEVTPSPGDGLTTLQPIDTRRPDAGVVRTSLSVLRESSLDIAFNVLALPIALDSERAQALLQVKRGEMPLAGVSVAAPGAELVIYADNGTFSDIATQTDPTGIVIVANVPAVPWPGSTVTLSLAGAVSGRWALRLVRGAVTFGSVGD